MSPAIVVEKEAAATEKSATKTVPVAASKAEKRKAPPTEVESPAAAKKATAAPPAKTATVEPAKQVVINASYAYLIYVGVECKKITALFFLPNHQLLTSSPSGLRIRTFLVGAGSVSGLYRYFDNVKLNKQG